LAEVVGRERKERVGRKEKKEGEIEYDLRGVKRGGIECLKLYILSMTHHAFPIALSVSRSLQGSP
jgi:hypothetical protein